ncbi:pectate trisaccharide-lyase [Cellvibrio sp. ARAG 10.3]|uniref:pectate lyase family protein n=1 Tax=Cellvibrio sp. ARAG 10.3 TaxID=3451358 RepID=UPI003F457B13
MKMRVPLLLRQCALGAGSLLTAAVAAAGPIGYATLNGGTTGGAGGQVVYASTGAQINQAMCNRASDDTPLIIYVSGTINHGNTQKYSGSCDTKDDEIQFKGVSNISLIGTGSGAVFDQIGIHLRDTSNIILQNLHIKNVKKSGSPTSNGGDAIGMESGVFNVWVDHCTLEATGGEDDGYDSLLDMKATTQYVTVSYTHYHHSGRGGLMGSSDSDDTNTFVTFHHNYYQDVDSRMPLLRHGTAHAFNNYYNGITKSGMNPRMGGKIKAEHNHFENANNPIGTFYTTNMGYWDLKDNIFENVTWTSASDEFPAGPNPVSTTSINIPYSYQLDAVNCVRDIVKATAGAGKGLATSDGSCSVDPGQPTSSSSASSVSSTPASSSSNSSTPGGELVLGTNLAGGAAADGTSKGGGTSYGNVTDGNLSSYWSPSSTSGERVSIKGLSGSFNTVIIRELNNATTSWRLINNDNGNVLASGTTLGGERIITGFGTISASKLNLMIDSANSAPQIAEFEMYNASGSVPASSASSASSATPLPSSSSVSSSAPPINETVRYEAESAYLYRGTVDNIHSGYSGTGFADYENVSDSYGEWTVNVPSAGQVTATFRFANGTTVNRPMAISVNGNVVNSGLAFSGTGGWASWATQSITLTLNAGTNVIRAASTTANGGPNVDYLEITTTGSAPASSASSTPVSSASSSSAPEPEPVVLGSNVAAGAAADGSSKGNGTSYGSVTDGNLGTYWSPSSTSGQRVSVKGLSGTFNTVIIRELNNATTSWRIVNNDNGAVLASGSSLGSERVISIGSVSASKLNLMIDSASSAPQIAEFEVYNASGDVGTSSSSANSSASSTPPVSSSSVAVSSSSSSVANSSSSAANSSLPNYSGPLSNDCINLATNPNVNWRDTSLQSDQEIVECLAQTLGQPVGYGENARGGYDPNGNSKLTVITKNGSTSVEQQIYDAITDNAHNWIVFDKFDFANPSEIAMYRLQCGNAAVQSHLGATEAQCINYTQWCSSKGISSANCVSEFFNNALNESDLPIRNTVVGSNKTLDGRMSEAFFRFNGFAIGRDSSGQAIQTSNSVILTHLNFVGAGHTEDHGLDPDMIRATGESHDIWIHRNNFDTTGDAAFDVKVGAYDITISYNKLVDVKRASLHGSSDSRTINEQITTTMHHNAFITRDGSYSSLGNTLRRVPLIRRGTSHMFNNVFVNYRKDILSIRVGASVLWEDNAFVVNRAHQEKSSLESSLDELQSNLVRDISGGSFRGEGIYLWFSDGACNIDSTTQRQITASSGSVGNLTQQYSSRSQNNIADWRFTAGQDLVDYVSATAGRDGVLPFNSPLAGDRYYVLGLGKVPCL